MAPTLLGRQHDHASMSGMDGMDMTDSMGAVAHGMKMYVHGTIGSDTLWFGSWVPTSAGATVGVCIGLFLLGVFDRYIHALWRACAAGWGRGRVFTLPVSGGMLAPKEKADDGGSSREWSATATATAINTGNLTSRPNATLTPSTPVEKELATSTDSDGKNKDTLGLESVDGAEGITACACGCGGGPCGGPSAAPEYEAVEGDRKLSEAEAEVVGSCCGGARPASRASRRSVLTSTSVPAQPTQPVQPTQPAQPATAYTQPQPQPPTTVATAYAAYVPYPDSYTASTAHLPRAVRADPRRQRRWSRPFEWRTDVPRGLLFTLQTTLHFLIMLVVMTFQLWWMISVIVGMGVGEAMFGRLGAPPPGAAV